MVIIRLLKGGLLFYECLRISFLAAFVYFSPANSAGFPGMVLISPSAIFPLMALFIWIDNSRYRAYMPLFAAGKCVGIFSLLVWIIFSGFIKAKAGSPFLELLLLSGDLLAAAAILLIIKDANKTTKTQNLEEKQCE